MRWCTREAGRGFGKPPSGQMAVVRAILQNPFPGHRRHQWGQGASQRRTGKACSPRPDRRSTQLVVAGGRRRIRGVGTAAAPRPRRGGANALPGDSAKRLAPCAFEGTAPIGAAVAAAERRPPRQARPPAPDAPQSRSGLRHLRDRNRCCSRGHRARSWRPFRAAGCPTRRKARPRLRVPRWPARAGWESGPGGSRAGSGPDCARR